MQFSRLNSPHTLCLCIHIRKADDGIKMSAFHSRSHFSRLKKKSDFHTLSEFLYLLLAGKAWLWCNLLGPRTKWLFTDAAAPGHWWEQRTDCLLLDPQVRKKTNKPYKYKNLQIFMGVILYDYYINPTVLGLLWAGFAENQSNQTKLS